MATEATGGHLVTIEYFKQRLDLAKRNLHDCYLANNITFISGKAIDVLGKIKPSLLFPKSPEVVPNIDQ